MKARCIATAPPPRVMACTSGLMAVVGYCMCQRRVSAAGAAISNSPCMAMMVFSSCTAGSNLANPVYFSRGNWRKVRWRAWEVYWAVPATVATSSSR